MQDSTTPLTIQIGTRILRAFDYLISIDIQIINFYHAPSKIKFFPLLWDSTCITLSLVTSYLYGLIFGVCLVALNCIFAGVLAFSGGCCCRKFIHLPSDQID